MSVPETSSTAFDVHALVRLGRVTAAEPAPDGSWLAVQVARLDADGKRYVSDLWRISAADADATPQRLTWGEHDDRSPRFRADGALLFLSTRPTPSDEKGRFAQVWMLPPSGGEARPLTDEPTGVDDFACGGDRLVVQTSVWPDVPHDEQRAHAIDRAEGGPSILRYDTMPVRSWDHWLPMAAPHLILHAGGQRTDLTPDADREHRNSPWAMSADGRRVVISLEAPATDRLPQSSLLILELDAPDGSANPVSATGHADAGVAPPRRASSTPSSSRLGLDAPGAPPPYRHSRPGHLGDGASRQVSIVPRALIEGLAVSPDGRWAVGEVHARTDGHLGRPCLWRFDLEAGRAEPLAPDWDVHPSVSALTVDRVLVTAGVSGQTLPFAVELADGAVHPLTAEGVGGSFRRLRPLSDGAVLALTDRLMHPPEVCRLDHGKSGPLARLSGFEQRWVEGVVLDDYVVKSSDGVAVHGLILDRPGAAPRPGLIWVHGGPVGQHEDGWHWRWNALTAVAAGYAVSLPNPRGSTGYGQAFVEGIWNNAWGGVCYDDVMASADHFEALPTVDAARVALMGASFGGYMTNWIGARSDRFRCLVSHAGVYRMSTFHGTSDWPAWFELQAGIDPAHPDFDRHSPHRLVGGWKTPTLVMHGDKDYRVPVSQALLLFEDLQRHGVDSELVIFPDENHWILRPRNVAAWYGAWIDFVGRHLAEVGAGA